jgi:hypothetical protein
VKEGMAEWNAYYHNEEEDEDQEEGEESGGICKPYSFPTIHFVFFSETKSRLLL